MTNLLNQQIELQQYLRLVNLAVGYHGRALISGLNESVCKGELIVIVGPNGAGKTTLLKTLAGILTPVSGEVVLGEGLTLSEISYMPQSPEIETLVPANVSEIVSMGIVHGRSFPGIIPAGGHQKIQAVLERLSLEALSKKPFYTLSGGQKRRALLARALVSNPRILICDEITTGLDPEATAEVVASLKKLIGSNEVAIICSTHNPEHLISAASKVWEISNGTLNTIELKESFPRDVKTKNTTKHEPH